MTMIMVDPAELRATADTLRSCAIENADIGSQLWACAQCAMPPAIDATVNELVAAADRALDASAAHLQARAGDLMNRAAIAAHDPITATSVATAPATTTTSIGDILTGMNIVGGSSGSNFTIGGTDPWRTGAIVGGSGSFLATSGVISGSGLLGPMVIGGSDSFLATSGVISGSGLLGPTVVGGGVPLGGTGVMSGVMALAQTAQIFRDRAQGRIDRIVANSSVGSPGFQMAMNAQSALGDSLSHTLAPSVRELEDRFGPLTTSQIEMISPHTLTRPVNIFEGVRFG
jgi:hypothetical protein